MKYESTAAPEASVRSSNARFTRLRATVVKQIRERPLTVAGITMAAGFVLGGGLATGTSLRLLRRSLGLALQMAVIPALLARLRETMLDEAED